MLGPVQNREPVLHLAGGNQPSSNLEPVAHGRRSRDYVMFVQRPILVVDEQVLELPKRSQSRTFPGAAFIV